MFGGSCFEAVRTVVSLLLILRLPSAREKFDCFRIGVCHYVSKIGKCVDLIVASSESLRLPFCGLRL